MLASLWASLLASEAKPSPPLEGKRREKADHHKATGKLVEQGHQQDRQGRRQGGSPSVPVFPVRITEQQSLQGIQIPRSLSDGLGDRNQWLSAKCRAEPSAEGPVGVQDSRFQGCVRRVWGGTLEAVCPPLPRPPPQPPPDMETAEVGCVRGDR